LDLPIIQNGFIEELTIGAGYRYSDYKVADHSFSTDTYKVTVELAPVEDIRFRGSYNRAVRAPNVVELFSAVNVGLGGTEDPCAGDFNPGTDQGEPTASAAAWRTLA
jgi:outer membrane receptor protein involved in Fe transport